MSFLNLAIPVCSLLAATASAIAAWNSATAAKASNILAQEALIKRAQSELFLKVMLELVRIHRLMTAFINADSSDADFCTVFDGKVVAELLSLLEDLNALSPKFRASFTKEALLGDLLQRMSCKGYVASKDDLILLQIMIDILQDSQRKELSSP